MDDKRWERLGLYGGIVGVVLIVAAILGMGSPPDSDASTAEIAEWYADNDSAIQVGAFLVGVAVIFILWWFGSLWRSMRRAEDGEARLSLIAALAVVLSGGMAMAAFALNSALAMEIADIDGGAGAFFAFQNTLIGMSTMANVILVGAVSALAIRTKFLPDWLAYGGAAISLLQLVGALTIASDSSGLARLAFLAFLLWLAWIVSITLVISRQEPSPTPA